MTLVKNLDIVLLALALPVFIAAGFPILGWAAGAGIWLGQRGLAALLDRKARGSTDPKTVVGINAGSVIGRGWLVALTIFGVGLADRQSGLAAAVLFLILFTLHFSVTIATRPIDEARRKAGP